MERILLYVEDTPGMAAAAAWTLKLARALSSRTFAVSVIDPAMQRRREAQAANVEERAWGMLYEIEDDAFQQNVRISLLLESGDPLQHVISLSSSYDIELVVASADCRLVIPELVRQSNRPVVFVK